MRIAFGWLTNDVTSEARTSHNSLRSTYAPHRFTRRAEVSSHRCGHMHQRCPGFATGCAVERECKHILSPEVPIRDINHAGRSAPHELAVCRIGLDADRPYYRRPGLHGDRAGPAGRH